MSDALDQKTLRSLLSYNSESGVFIWLRREETDGLVRAWNKKYAGAMAGSKNNRGYICICITLDGVSIKHKAHRLAWLYTHGKFPPTEIDHINQTTCDNRIVNLRLATRSQNVRNTPLKKTNKSGFPGISWYKRGNKWQVQISVGGRQQPKRVRHIGYFNDLEMAKAAYARVYAECSKEFPVYSEVAA